MTLTEQALPQIEAPAADPSHAATSSRLVSSLLWLQGCILLGLAQVLLAGYHVNIGNQTIQIPFLKRWIDPGLYPNDPTVDTINSYPSFFFRGLAIPAKLFGVEATYLILHLLTASLVLAGVYALAKAMFRDVLSGMLMILLLFAGHHHALAGDELYSPGFTHTWAAFPIAIAVLVLLYRDWPLLAFVLAGLLFNLHALTAAYLAAMMGLWALWEWRRLGILKVLLLGISFLAAASPTLWMMLRQPQHFDEQWIALTYLRSADHSFPSSWWQPGTRDIPEFALLAGLWALSMGFPMKARQRRKTLVIAAAVGVLFLVGYFCADVKPVKVVIRAQLFRASRLVMVIMMAHIAYAASWSLRLAVEGKTLRRQFAGALETLAWGFAVLCLALPPLDVYLPAAFAAVALVALVNGRLSWFQAAVTAAVGLVLLLAWYHIEFDIPGIYGRAWRITQRWPAARLAMPFWIGLSCGIGLWLASRFSPGKTWRGLILAQGVAVVGLLGASVYKTLIDTGLGDPDTYAWVELQQWAKANTPKTALFLTPPQSAKGGFRVFSERPVVCEWRDGTQMYFSAKFDSIWWGRLNAVSELMLDGARRHIVSRKTLDDLSDSKLMDLAKEFKVCYLVLPKKASRELVEVFESGKWAIYKPQWAQTLAIDDSKPLAPPPADADPRRWIAQEEFIRRTALPNIEKYRKGRVQIQIMDESGKPIEGLAYDVQLTKHAFKFGASIPFFMPVEGGNSSDYKPPPVTPKELEHFLEVFNYTVIPFSAKWMYLEPKEGDKRYQELDKYVEWCTQHGIDMEFHFLSGLWPTWLAAKPLAVKGDLYRKHAQELVDRYADRIINWQVVNDKWLLQYAPTVIKDIRERHPGLSLGSSDCTMFYAGEGADAADREATVYRGLDDVESLANVGAKLDFHSMHGHAPHGVWPDPKQMYDTFDKFAEQGVRVHVSEFQVPLYHGRGEMPERAVRRGGRGAPASGGAALTAYPIRGPIRRGPWNHQNRAEFFERFYTVAFSHPAVDAINYWNLGPSSLEPGSGLLDEKYEVTPEFLKLKELIKDKWTTKLSGKLADDGNLSFRGFFGDYEITVTPEGGKPIKATFSVRSDREDNNFKLKLDREKGTLVLAQD